MTDPHLRHLDDWLSAYLDGELTPSARAEAERQLADDPAARLRLDELARLTCELGALPRQALPDDFAAQIQARIERDAQPHRAARRSWWTPRRVWPIGSAAAIGLAVWASIQWRSRFGHIPDSTLLVDAGAGSRIENDRVPLAEGSANKFALKSTGSGVPEAIRYKNDSARRQYGVAEQEEARKSAPAATIATGEEDGPSLVANAPGHAPDGRASDVEIAAAPSAPSTIMEGADIVGVDASTTLAMRFEQPGQDGSTGDSATVLKKAGQGMDAEIDDAGKSDVQWRDLEVARRLLAVATLDQKITAGVDDTSLHKHWFGNEPRQMVLVASDDGALERVGAVLASVATDDAMQAGSGGFVGGERLAWKGMPGGNFEPAEGESQWVVRFSRSEWPELMDRLSAAGGEQVSAELFSGDVVLNGWAAAQAAIAPETAPDAVMELGEALALGYRAAAPSPPGTPAAAEPQFDKMSVASQTGSSVGGAVTAEQAIEDLVGMLGRSAVTRRQRGEEPEKNPPDEETVARFASAEPRSGGTADVSEHREASFAGRKGEQKASARTVGQPSEAKPAPETGATTRARIESDAKSEASKDRVPATNPDLVPKPAKAEGRRESGAGENERASSAKLKEIDELRPPDGDEDAHANDTTRGAALGETAKGAAPTATSSAAAPTEHESLAARRLRAVIRVEGEPAGDAGHPEQAGKTIQSVNLADGLFSSSGSSSSQPTPHDKPGAPATSAQPTASLARARIAERYQATTDWVTVVIRLRVAAPAEAPSESGGEAATAPKPPSPAPPEHPPQN